MEIGRKKVNHQRNAGECSYRQAPTSTLPCAGLEGEFPADGLHNPNGGNSAYDLDSVELDAFRLIDLLRKCVDGLLKVQF